MQSRALPGECIQSPSSIVEGPSRAIRMRDGSRTRTLSLWRRACYQLHQTYTVEDDRHEVAKFNTTTTFQHRNATLRFASLFRRTALLVLSRRELETTRRRRTAHHCSHHLVGFLLIPYFHLCTLLWRITHVDTGALHRNHRLPANELRRRVSLSRIRRRTRIS